MKDKSKSVAKDKVESLGYVAINDYKRIVVSLVSYRGKESLDIREQVDMDQNPINHNWIFTKHGCRIPIDKIKKFRALVKKTDEFIR